MKLSLMLSILTLTYCFFSSAVQAEDRVYFESPNLGEIPVTVSYDTMGRITATNIEINCSQLNCEDDSLPLQAFEYYIEAALDGMLYHYKLVRTCQYDCFDIQTAENQSDNTEQPSTRSQGSWQKVKAWFSGKADKLVDSAAEELGSQSVSQISNHLLQKSAQGEIAPFTVIYTKTQDNLVKPQSVCRITFKQGCKSIEEVKVFNYDGNTIAFEIPSFYAITDPVSRNYHLSLRDTIEGFVNQFYRECTITTIEANGRQWIRLFCYWSPK